MGHNYNYNNKNKNNKPALLSTERLKARVYSDNKDYSATNASTMNIELPTITLGFSVCYFCCTIKLGKKSYNVLNSKRRFSLLVSLKGPLETLQVKKPNREIVRAEVQFSGDLGCLPIGLSFTRFAASWHIVCRLKKIITLPPTTTVITFFMDFTRASEVLFLLRSIGWKKSPFHSLFRAGRGQLVPISRFGHFPKLLVATVN